jgi:hypothetical protein
VGVAPSWVADWASWVSDRDHGAIWHNMCCPVHVGTCSLRYVYPHNICVEWCDGTTSWIPLKDLKVSNPIKVTEYAVSHNLSQEPAFSWWVHDTLKKHNCIIAANNTRYVKHTHKFGIELPKTVEDALEIDCTTNTSYWYDAIQKEMCNNAIAFEFLNEGDTVPPGYTKISLHMVFDIKLISLARHNWSLGDTSQKFHLTSHT